MKNVFLCLIVFLPLSAHFQIIDDHLLEGMNMRHIGPGTMSGRVTSIDLVEENPSIIYIGTASGGMWKSESGGVTWDPIFDNEDVLSIGAIAVDQTNPAVLWAGTGEGNPRNSHSSGGGIYKSLDGGRTWELKGLEATMNIHRILIDPQNPNVVYAAALGSIWGSNKERGIFKTTDGGETWEHNLKLGETTGCAELVMDPTNPNKLFASMWEFGRQPWFFNSGGPTSALLMTIDGGKNWTALEESNGLPSGEYGRIGIAIAESNPKVVYALVEAETTGLYRSDDGGYNWSLQATENIGNRPFYYAEIYVHPENENCIYNLYSMVSKSEDAGKTFKVILPYSGVHPDHHAFYIHPKNPDLILDGNDGGLNISRDGGENWQFVSNLPLGQFYHINYDMDVPYNIYGGMQDNGSWQGPGYVWHSGGIRNEDWQEISFGDGFDVVPVPNDLDHAYSMYQGGNVYDVDLKTGSMTYIQPVHPEGKPLRFNWNGAIAQDPMDNNSLYFGSQYLHYSRDRGASWEIMSPDLTSNDPEKQQQAISGGLTIDATRAENYTTITCIAPSQHDKSTIWVGTDDGNVQLTRDGGNTWQNLNSNIRGFRKGCWITQIVVGQKSGEAFLVMNDYRRNHWEPYLFHTYNYGASWENLVSDVEGMAHCHAIVQDPEQTDLLFLGTERGLYFSLDKGVNWQKWTIDFPSVPTIDLKIHPREGDLIVGTFGRAAYILDDLEPMRQMCVKGPKLQNEDVIVFDAPDCYLASYRRPLGSRFGADHLWSGANKRRGAVFSAFFSEEAMNGGDEKAQVTILNQNGDSIRSLRFQPDTGITRFSWDLKEAGVFWPNRSERKNDALPGSGAEVEPGVYKLILRWGDHLKEARVSVLEDPRVPHNPSLHASKTKMIEELETVVQRADSMFLLVMKNQKSIDLATKNFEYINDSSLADVKTRMDSVNTGLIELELLYMNAKDFKGYDHVTERLNSVLWNAMSFIESMSQVDAPNAVNSLNHAKKEADRVHKEIELFFEQEWIPLLEELEMNSLLPK